MIPIAFCNAFLGVFNKIIVALNIPKIPDNIVNAIKQVSNYLYSGRCLINYFIDGKVINICVLTFVSVLSFFFLYDLIMWLLKKIPFASIE